MIARVLRRHGTTLALTALALGGAAVVLGVDRGSVSTREAEARKKNLFPAFRPDEVTEIAVTSHGATGTLRRGPVDDAGQRPWEIEEGGARWPVEEQAVDQLLASLRDGVAERKLAADAVSLGAAGLDPPRAAIAIEMGSQRWKLLLGGPAPTPPGAIYAAVVGQGTMVITAQLAAALDLEPSSFRSRTIVPYVASDLAALALDGAGGPRHLTRSAWSGADAGAAALRGGRGAGFRFDGTTPEGSVRVAAPALDRVWGAFGRMQAEAFLSDAAADRAAQKTVTVTLTPREPGRKRAVIEVGGACPGRPDDVVAIRREPGRVSACVPRSALDDLSLPAGDFVDRALIGAPADEVTEVKLAAGGAPPIEIARLKTGWHQRSPMDRDVEGGAGRSLLEALLAIEADGFAPHPGDLTALGLGPPRATVRVVSVVPAGPVADAADADRVESLEIGAERDGVVFVRRVEDDVIARVPKDRAAALFPSELALRSKKIFDESVPSFRAIRVEARGRVQRIERAADGSLRWIEPKGEGLAPDAGLVNALLDALGGLTAERWIGPAAKEHALDAPRFTLSGELGGAGNERSLKVVIGAPSDTGSFARRDGDPAVFVAPKALEAAADRWLLDRGALQIEPAQIARATIADDAGKRLVIEQVGGAFRVAGAASDAAATARAAAVRDALGDLVAEGAVSVGPPEKAQGLDRPRLTIDVERAGGAAPLRIAIGAADAFRGTAIHYARRDGVAATYALAQAKIQPLLEALGARR